ncbi:MAG: hypothetical protein ABSB80_09135 [Methanoregula sp.]|uniref:hypothetical protein n=1 Tax=Methanoregula sp. TaxID=2052170 RepID=UPI003D0A0FAB
MGISGWRIVLPEHEDMGAVGDSSVSVENRIIRISLEGGFSFIIAMNAAAVEDFSLKIFSTTFGCPQRGACRDMMGRAGLRKFSEREFSTRPETRQEEVFPNFLCFIRTG